jgi:ribosomal protein S18 acetylase RimI-like enzyme
MKLVIRRANERDANGLFELNELFNGKGSTTIERLQESLQYNKQEIVFIALADEKPVGFICGQVFMSMCYDTYYGEISELFVLEAYRRRGVARQLIVRIEEEFKKNNIFSFQLFTGADNITAQTLYTSCGYTRSEEWMYRKRVSRS